MGIVKQLVTVFCFLLGGCTGMTTADVSPEAPLPGDTGVMRGMYSYLADAALFTDCRSGRHLPVALEADNRALERAYLQARPRPAEALLVTLEGRVVQRMPMEGPGPVATLLPERFIGIQPAKSCESALTKAELLDTHWRLTYLGAVMAVHYPEQREPHIVLHADSRVTGSDGCNLLSGEYQRTQDSIVFSRIAMTRMACPQGLEQERAFSTALAMTARYRILYDYLELLDEAGAVVARFESTPPDWDKGVPS